MEEIAWLRAPCKPIATHSTQAALRRQSQLTKPAGALGRLEEIAVLFAGWQGQVMPALTRIGISVFAADHGIAQEPVSAYPQAVTAQMIRNFSQGGAAINVLAKHNGASLEVINLGTVNPLPPLAGVIAVQIAPGTQNFLHQAAMSVAQCHEALWQGKAAVNRWLDQQSQCFIGGEMGIGNTTAAAALTCALLHCTPEQAVGSGTGIQAKALSRKIEVVSQAVAKHGHDPDPLLILQKIGGLEIAALSGAYIACAQAGIPVIVDGYIASAAALVAWRINPGIKPWLLFSHVSAEPGHRLIFAAFGMQPFLDLGMRLGEGTGATLMLSMIQQALVLHREMATFQQAQVSEKLS